MGNRMLAYVAAAVSRRTLRPHIPSAAQIRRGVYAGAPAWAVPVLQGTSPASGLAGRLSRSGTR